MATAAPYPVASDGSVGCPSSGVMKLGSQAPPTFCRVFTVGTPGRKVPVGSPTTAASPSSSKAPVEPAWTLAKLNTPGPPSARTENEVMAAPGSTCISQSLPSLPWATSSTVEPVGSVATTLSFTWPATPVASRPASARPTASLLPMPCAMPDPFRLVPTRGLPRLPAACRGQPNAGPGIRQCAEVRSGGGHHADPSVRRRR